MCVCLCGRCRANRCALRKKTKGDKKVAEFAMENEIEGFEFLSCIPGSIGGGIKMNAGCFSKEFKDIIVSVQAIDFYVKVLTIPASNISFNYSSTDL